MYVPKFFEVREWPEIFNFIKDNSLATLVTCGENHPAATHVPLELQEDEGGKIILSGHVARANQQWKSFESHPDVLAIFLSPIHHYISSSWYSHPNVPTWNYMSVHVYGKLKIVDGERLKRSLERMTKRHEHVSSHSLSPEVLRGEIDKQMDAIVGFELDIEKVEAAYKMSQNRNDEDYANIVKELKRLQNYNAEQVAGKMSEIRKIG